MPSEGNAAVTVSGRRLPMWLQLVLLSEQQTIVPCGSVMKTWFPVLLAIELRFMLSDQECSPS